MKFRDKEKNLLVNTFLKTAEFVLSIVALGTVISGRFNLVIFLVGIFIFIGLIIAAVIISSKTKDKDGE